MRSGEAEKVVQAQARATDGTAPPEYRRSSGGGFDRFLRIATTIAVAHGIRTGRIVVVPVVTVPDPTPVVVVVPVVVPVPAPPVVPDTVPAPNPIQRVNHAPQSEPVVRLIARLRYLSA